MADGDPLTPERLQEAALVLAAWPDGSAHLTLADYLDDREVAAYLRTVADQIESGHHRDGCPDCAAGVPHGTTASE